MSSHGSSLQKPFRILRQARPPAPGAVHRVPAEGPLGLAAMTPKLGCCPRWTVSPVKGPMAPCSSPRSQPSNLSGDVMTAGAFANWSFRAGTDLQITIEVAHNRSN